MAPRDRDDVRRPADVSALVDADGPECYVLVERSARLERDGYDLVVWHVVLEAFASDTR